MSHNFMKRKMAELKGWP